MGLSQTASEWSSGTVPGVFIVVVRPKANPPKNTHRLGTGIGKEPWLERSY